MKKATALLHTGNEIDPTTGAVSVPIYQVSTFHQESIENFGKYDYARSGNPTREALENIIASLEGGTRGFAFGSGMAAISSVLLMFSPGDHLVAAADIYGGTFRLITKVLHRMQIDVDFVDTTDLKAIKAAIKENTKALILESPSNPLLKVTDLVGAVQIAKEHNLLTIIDNTFMTPYFLRPLDLGIDITIHSGTKFLGGHSDVVAGLVVVKDKKLANEIGFLQNCLGGILGPQDCWLLMRGIKTLKVRMEEHQRVALIVAKWLQDQPQVKDVFYPGLENHPGHEILAQQAEGFGGVLSFDVGDVQLAKQIMSKVKIPAVAVSLGAVESILSYPVKMSHAAIPQDIREKLGITDSLMRLSVGLEDPEDIIADLKQAMEG